MKPLNIPIPNNEPILYITAYKASKRKWYELWKPKYDERLIATTKSATYDVTEFIEAQNGR